MGRFLSVGAVAALAILASCKDKKPQGLAPAQDWNANAAAMPPAPGAADPHAGNPHAGTDMAPMAQMGVPGEPGGANNPHAGLDMGGGDDPHAGVDMGGGSPNVAAMGLPAPDPNRPIDPNHRVTGVIKVHPKAKDRLKAGGAIFVIVKRAGPDGAPMGPPVAVDKLTWPGKDLPFKMTEAQSMIAGTELSGDVIVTARYDQDSDAISKQSGDVSGSIRVKVPADNVSLVLDDVLP